MRLYCVANPVLRSIAGLRSKKLCGRSLKLCQIIGITGIIVSIGVSLDSNIVFFEHMKEDIRNGRSPRSASERSFAGAFSTVLKADLASLLGAATLFFLTSGAVRGFAFYLGLATVLDLVATYFFLGPIVKIIGRTRNWLRYDVPDRWVRREWRGHYRGQKQIWFLLRMVGQDNHVSLRASAHPEFDAWRWNDYWVPLESVIEFKRDVYQMALTELARFLPRATQHNRYLRSGMRPHHRDDAADRVRRGESLLHHEIETVPALSAAGTIEVPIAQGPSAALVKDPIA